MCAGVRVDVACGSGTGAPQGAGARSTGGGTGTIGADGTDEARGGGGEGAVGDVFVDVDGVGVLTQVVETGEAAGAVTLEWPFAGVFAERG